VDIYLLNNKGEQALKIAKEAETRMPDSLQFLDVVARSYMSNRQPDCAQQIYALAGSLTDCCNKVLAPPLLALRACHCYTCLLDSTSQRR
jgi:hypothetical protein